MSRPIQAKITTRPDDSRPDEALLREAFSHWAAGVAVLAVRDESGVDAITVTAFTPLSVRPPMVLACLDEQSSVLATLLEEQRFTVNLLREDAQRTAGIVASRGPLTDLPFAPKGDPRLTGALAAFTCVLADTCAGGDHRIVLGTVESVHLGPEGGPLLYFRREYRGLRGR